MDIMQDLKAQLLVEYSKDRQACDILDGTHGDDRYQVMEDVIYYKDRIYLVPSSQLREKILHAAHDSPLARHQRFYKTYKAIRESFTWQGLKKDGLKHIRDCDTCQRNKGEHTYPVELLQSLSILERKCEIISMDFITRFPAVQGERLHLCGC